MNNRRNIYDFMGNPVPPHPVLDLNGFTPGYVQPYLPNGPTAIHPGTGILPIDEIPVFAGFDLPFETELPTPTGSRPGKPRRRRTADGDVIKHRRTRNGCYTCRSRRIKCDEGRPSCERCKKGTRDCVYPDAPAPKPRNKSPKGTSDSPKSPKSPELTRTVNDDPMAVDKDEMEESVTSGDARDQTEESQVSKEDSPASTVSQTLSKAKQQQASAFEETSIVTTETEPHRHRERAHSVKRVNFEPTAVIYGSPQSSVRTMASTDKLSELDSANDSPFISYEDPEFAQLDSELRDLLKYHVAHMGFHHYFFRQDASQFVKDLLPTAALSYEPLTYAVCTFAAYHRAVALDGRIEDFLGYYQKAVTLLLQSLKSGKEHTDSTVMTILQLATFEEYLGDWVNLMGHLAAARELIYELYTPSSMTQTETRRKIFSWYARFDIFVGMASGHQPTLEKEWLIEMERWHYNARGMDPSSVDLQIRWLVSHKRVLSKTLTELSSKTLAGQIDKAEFESQYHDLMKQEAAWGRHIVSLTTASEATEPLPDLSSINPNEPDADHDPSIWPEELERAPCFYSGSGWGINLMYIDFYSTSAIQRFNFARIMDLPKVAAEGYVLLKEECRMVEALTNSSSVPEDSILLVQASLALIGLFMKNDQYYRDWCRQKFAKLENLGYFFPPLYRDHLARSWNEPSVREWWLPDGSGHRTIIKSLRAFNQEREAKPRDQLGQDIRNLRGLFDSLVLEKQESGVIVKVEEDGDYKRKDDSPLNSIEGASTSSSTETSRDTTSLGTRSRPG